MMCEHCGKEMYFGKVTEDWQCTTLACWKLRNGPVADDSLPYVPDSDTSQAAAESMATQATGDRRRIMEHVRRQGEHGATCDECEVALQISHQTCSARIRELRGSRWILDSGRRRNTRSGRAACVYVLDRKLK